MHRSQKKWNLIYTLLFILGIGVFLTTLGLVGNTSRATIFRILITSSTIIIGLTILQLVNYVLRNKLFRSRILTSLALIVTSFLSISWTMNFSPSPELICEISLTDLEVKIENGFKADSVKIAPVTIQEELYFPKLIAPRVTVYNAKLDIQTDGRIPEEHYEQLGQKFADRIYRNCEMNSYNDIIVVFLKCSEERQQYSLENISHYYTTAYENENL